MNRGWRDKARWRERARGWKGNGGTGLGDGKGMEGQNKGIEKEWRNRARGWKGDGGTE